MNIDQLVANLENTIAGKEALLRRIDRGVVRQFVEINLDELKKILVDAKAVQEQVHQLEADLDGYVHGCL